MTTRKLDPILVTSQETAEILGLQLREIRKLVYAGELERRWIGDGSRYYRITYASIIEYANALPEAQVVKKGTR